MGRNVAYMRSVCGISFVLCFLLGGLVFQSNFSDFGYNIQKDLEQPVVSNAGDCIYIDGFVGWTAFRAAGNCTGSGTEIDPYVIRDRVIDAEGSNDCVFIANSSVYFKIENCTFLNAGTGYGIILKNVTHGVLLRNNVTNCLYGIILSYNCTLDFVEANNIMGTDTAIGLDHYCKGNTIQGNQICGNHHGIVVQFNSTANYVINNNVSANTGKGIYVLYYSGSNIIKENIVSDNIAEGLLIGQCENNTISNNSVSLNDRYGIWLHLSNKSIVQNNIVSNNTLSGICLEANSTKNLITFNEVENNSESGVLFIDFCHNNTCVENSILNNTLDGVVLIDGCANNTFIDNDIALNLRIGANLTSSCSDNLFYMNNFITNEINALDDGVANQWDNGSIGNFWGNYGGADTNDDGIGEVPQGVPGAAGDQDNFPIWSDADEMPPNIEVLTPENYTLCGITSPTLDIIVTDQVLDEVWYGIEGGSVNISISADYSGPIDSVLWDIVQNGTLTVLIYANDTSGHESSVRVILLKDMVKPVVDIIEPTNFAFLNGTAPKYNVTIIEGNLDTVWLEIRLSNGTIWNYTIPSLTGTIPQELWDQVPMGIHRIRVYANDTAGNVGYDEVIFTKTTGQIPGYPPFILVGIVICSIISLTSSKRFRKHIRFF